MSLNVMKDENLYVLYLMVGNGSHRNVYFLMKVSDILFIPWEIENESEKKLQQIFLVQKKNIKIFYGSAISNPICLMKWI